VFGHIHESSGMTEVGGTTFVNACIIQEENMESIIEIIDILNNEEA
jgi:Icc-related predicted phosphoesterase